MNINILGCGWLGFPLAKKLIENGLFVKGSTTSIEKIEKLEKVGIQPYLVSLSENGISSTIVDFLNNCEILIIDIPPKLRGDHSENFVQKIQNIIPFVIEARIKKVLFVSSTSVYGDTTSGIVEVTEETSPNPTTESGKQLLQVEKLLQDNSNFKTTVLRFGGLIGPDRHPVKQLAGRENLENANAPINLIHQTDCIEIIEAIIQQNLWGEVFNAVAPIHPSRKEYYTQKAQQLGLPLPHFKAEESKTNKIISSDKVETILKHTFNTQLY